MVDDMGKATTAMTTPGLVKLVAATEVDAWVFDFDLSATSGMPFGPQARDAFQNASLAVPRTVPVLFGGIAPSNLRATQGQGYALRNGRVVTKTEWDGPSFGLGFYLALAGRAFGLPVPGDLVASAAIDAFGCVLPVHHIAAKLEGLHHAGISRLLVAQKQQVPQNTRGVEVIRAGNAHEALRTAFGGELASHLFPPDASEQQRQHVVASYFRSAFLGRNRVAVEWKPIADGAQIAAQTWNLNRDDKARLGFAAAVARRHADNLPSTLLPPATWIESLPGTQRIEAAAHYVQCASDTGSPEADVIAALRKRWLGEPDDDGPEQLKLRGALARYDMLRGEDHARTALVQSEIACRGWIVRLMEDEATYPIAMMYLLAGALHDEDALGRADALHRVINDSGLVAPSSRVFIDVAALRAQVDLRRDPPPVDALHRLMVDPSAPDHVAVSAWRTLRRVQPDADPDVPKGGGWLQPAFSALVAIDCELATTRDAGRLATALTTLRESQWFGHITKTLEASARLQTLEGKAEHVARFFPY